MKLHPLIFIVPVLALGACKPKTTTVETPVATPTPAATPIATSTPGPSPMATPLTPESSAAPASVAPPTAMATPDVPAVNGHVYLVKRHTKATDSGLIAFKEGTLAQVTAKNGKTVTLYLKGQTIEVPLADVTTESPVASAE